MRSQFAACVIALAPACASAAPDQIQVYMDNLTKPGGVGPHLGRLGEQAQTLYAVVDAEIGKLDVNAGIGRGLTAASDRWVAKFILGLQD